MSLCASSPGFPLRLHRLPSLPPAPADRVEQNAYFVSPPLWLPLTRPAPRPGKAWLGQPRLAWAVGGDEKPVRALQEQELCARDAAAQRSWPQVEKGRQIQERCFFAAEVRRWGAADSESSGGNARRKGGGVWEGVGFGSAALGGKGGTRGAEDLGLSYSGNEEGRLEMEAFGLKREGEREVQVEERNILDQQRSSRSGRPRIVEPASAEFLSALAAGINAQHIVQVGCGLSTVALAAAAKATGSRLTSLHTEAEKQKIVGQCLRLCGLSDYVQFFCGDPCDIVSRRQDIDFVFIGGDADIYIALFDLLNLKPGAIVVADYALDESTNEYIRHVRRQPGVDSSTLPVCRGLEITKILNWDDFKNGRTRYVRSSSPGPSRPVDIEDPRFSNHSDVLSESSSSLHSNPTSVSSVFAAEAWMASKAATFRTGRGNSDKTYEVETYSYAAQELAFSVNSSISSVHAAEEWMAAQAVRAFYSSSRDDDDEYYELEPERHDAGDTAHHVNGNASDHSDFDEGHAKYDDSHLHSGQIWQFENHNHDGEELATPRNGFVLGQTDHKSEKSDALDGPRQAEVQDGDPERYVLQESVLLPNRISCHKVESDKNTKYKSTFPFPNTVTGESGSARLEDFQSSTGFSEGYFHMEPRRGMSRKFQASEELHSQSQVHSEYVGDLLSHGTVIEQKLAADALESSEQEPKFEITFQDDDGQTAVMIQGVDQDMLLFDITMAFNESGVSVRRAKINTTMEKCIEDIFYVVDSKTGTALDISSWDTVRGKLLSKLIKP